MEGIIQAFFELSNTHEFDHKIANDIANIHKNTIYSLCQTAL
jgi:hypothetical protein